MTQCLSVAPKTLGWLQIWLVFSVFTLEVLSTHEVKACLQGRLFSFFRRVGIFSL